MTDEEKELDTTETTATAGDVEERDEEPPEDGSAAGTIGDVDHEPPTSTSANAVWARGDEPVDTAVDDDIEDAESR